MSNKRRIKKRKRQRIRKKIRGGLVLLLGEVDQRPQWDGLSQEKDSLLDVMVDVNKPLSGLTHLCSLF